MLRVQIVLIIFFHTSYRKINKLYITKHDNELMTHTWSNHSSSIDVCIGPESIDSLLFLDKKKLLEVPTVLSRVTK